MTKGTCQICGKEYSFADTPPNTLCERCGYSVGSLMAVGGPEPSADLRRWQKDWATRGPILERAERARDAAEQVRDAIVGACEFTECSAASEALLRQAEELSTMLKAPPK